MRLLSILWEYRVRAIEVGTWRKCVLCDYNSSAEEIVS
jgi:hypothetical protein